MVLLHCPDGCLPLTVIHVMVLVWGKDPQKLREVCASRVIVQTPGQKGKCDYFPMKRLHYSSERTRIRAKKVLSLLQRWGTSGEERTTMLYLSTKEFQPCMNSNQVKLGKTHEDPGPIMNLKGFGGFPVISLAGAWHHCFPKDPWGVRGTNLRLRSPLGQGTFTL